MVQQVTITVNAAVEILPLIQSALQTEVGILALGLERTRQRLRGFEEQYQITSAEFEQRFEAGEMDDSFDFIEWAGEIKTFQLLEAQQMALQGAKLS